METIKKFLLWNYSRTTLQYDVLCVLILVFIFLTPRSWFANSEFTARKKAAQRGFSTIFLENTGGAATLAPQNEIEQRVRRLTQQPDTKIIQSREKRDPQTGQILGYEVDIR